MESPYKRLQKAQVLVGQKAWHTALPLLEELWPLLKGEGLDLLATCARECGRYDLAVQAGQAYAEGVQTVQAFLFVATTALRIPDYERAERALEEAYRLCQGSEDPFFESVVRLRALVGEALGGDIDLLARAKEWYQTNPKAEKAVAFYLQQLYFRDELVEVVRLSRLSCTAEQTFWRVWGSYAFAAQALGLLDEALKAHWQAYHLDGGAALGSNALYCMPNLDHITQPVLEKAHVQLCEELWPGNGTPRMPPSYRLGSRRPWDGRRRLRIGYVSGDFSFHSVGSFLISLIEKHDRARFEIFCYNKRDEEDQMKAIFRSLSDGWRDIYDLDDDEAVQRIAQDDIDVLVDLAGHTSPCSLGIFARRPAPVQVTWLGYPDITGLAAMDARFSDRIVDPCDSDGQPPVTLSGERIIHLPRGYHCWRSQIISPDVTPLPEGPPLLGYFGSLGKMSQTTFKLWVDTLKAAPEARLLMKRKGLDNAATRQYFFDLFAEAGIPPERIVLNGWSAGKKEHLSAYSEIHLALDAAPYNGTTTVCEGLWMGVPSISLRGERGRRSANVTESLYAAVGQDLVDQFIAVDRADYAAKVAGLIADRPRLAQWRATLRQRITDSPLRDEEGFARDFEAAIIGLVKDLGR